MKDSQICLNGDDIENKQFYFPIIGTETDISEDSLAYIIYQCILEE